MIAIDAHQHFWQFDPVRDAWITASMQVIRRDFLPEHLQPLLAQNGVEACVAVQADQSETETHFLLDLAAKNPFVKGVVGWVDLRDSRLNERLDRLAAFPALKGFRHILQGEKPEFMLQNAFIEGVRLIGQRGYTYDILVFPRHLDAVRAFLRRLPDQSFIIDHLAKPYIKRGLIRRWAEDMRRIAKYGNVSVKVSGIVTEADWAHWRAEQIEPYLDVVLEAFGPQRLVYGSDWPVCLLAADYERQRQLVRQYFQRLSAHEQALIFGGNAAAFYRLTG